jgi:hypothetical protein
MRKINLITLIGSVLVLIGLYLPWFSFSVTEKDVLPKTTLFEISPFFINILSEESKEFMWFQMNIGAQILSLLCFIGAIIGLFGGYFNRRLSFAGGGISLFAAVMFPTTLPGHYHLMKFEWGGILVIIGSFLMILSTVLEVNPPSRSNLNRLKERTALAFRRQPLNRKLRLYLEALALLGTIYCSYELSRIVFLTLSKESITLTLSGYPYWIFWVEIALCLYTPTYWILRSLLFFQGTIQPSYKTEHLDPKFKQYLRYLQIENDKVT